MGTTRRFAAGNRKYYYELNVRSGLRCIIRLQGENFIVPLRALGWAIFQRPTSGRLSEGCIRGPDNFLTMGSYEETVWPVLPGRDVPARHSDSKYLDLQSIG